MLCVCFFLASLTQREREREREGGREREKEREREREREREPFIKKFSPLFKYSARASVIGISTILANHLSRSSRGSLRAWMSIQFCNLHIFCIRPFFSHPESYLESKKKTLQIRLPNCSHYSNP